MTERNLLKYSLPLRLISFRNCEVVSCFSGANSMHLSYTSKFHPSISFLDYLSNSPFSNFASVIDSGLPYFSTDCGEKTV